jgi:hypothetical protein
MKSFYIIILFAALSLSIYSQTANVTSHDFLDTSNSKKYIIAVKYPQVDFGPDALMGVRGIAQDINNSVDTLKDNLINDFRNELKNIPPDAPCAKETSGLNVEYTTVYNNNELFSFSFDAFSSPVCSNHPYKYITTLNYSTTSVGAFALGDIFQKDKPYVKFISEYCITELKKRASEEKVNAAENIDEGAAPVEDNFRVFNVSSTALIITFNPYKVGPWIWGVQTVTIPLREIKSMVDPNGPLSSVIK